jgi:hypothetical protein
MQIFNKKIKTNSNQQDTDNLLIKLEKASELQKIVKIVYEYALKVHG